MKVEKYTIAIGVTLTCICAYLSNSYFDYKKNPDPGKASQKILDTIDVLSLRYNDFKYKARSEVTSIAPVAMIAVDDDSLREVGRWPWSRELMAQLTQNLIELGAINVTYDVIFSEPERGFPESDLKLKSVIEKNSDKIVLGSSSEHLMRVRPYQDYCVTEAFLQNGGDQLVKLNPGFIVDDVSGDYDSLEWNTLFQPLFLLEKTRTEQIVLKELNKPNVDSLTFFQKNYLQSKQSAALFNYCEQWLTKEDPYLQSSFVEQVLPWYEKLFSSIETADSFEEKVKIFKSSILPHPIPQYGEWTPNIAVLQEPSSYTASFIAQQDQDGYVRRYPLFFRSGNRLGSSYIPSLALQSYLIAKNYRAEVKIEKLPGQQSKGITAFKIIDGQSDPEKTVMNLPVDSKGQLLINYYGRQMSFPYVSAKELLNDNPKVRIRQALQNSDSKQLIIKEEAHDKKEFFKGKSVILGATAIGIYDLRTTPLEANYPGPEIHLTVLANLLEQKFIRTIDAEKWTMCGLIFLLGLVFSVLWSYVGAVMAFTSFAAVVLTIVGSEYYLFFKKDILVSGFLPLQLLVLIFTIIIVIKYFSEEVKKKQIRATFSKYVSPAVVDELLHHSDNLKLGGRKQVMSVFFSDVRGFTTISEKLSPTDLSDLLNSYLSPMTDIVFNNSGTLDKYMGDAIMAFFGAPVATEQHAHQACRCALQSLVKLKELQEEFRRKDLPNIDIGIGINTGEMSVGNMGSNIVQSYTVMGDSVNLASRLEGINKQYGTRIVISEFTQARVKNEFISREIDWVKVKGKNEPVRIFELIQEGAANEDLQKWLIDYQLGFDLYHKKDFTVALETFKKIFSAKPEDSVAELYIERCEDFLAHPPPEDWDGVYESKTK
ncbi:MAG: CHASE2 domain-containing protein [Pseudobdellovibrionaceae bacterium]